MQDSTATPSATEPRSTEELDLVLGELETTVPQPTAAWATTCANAYCVP